MSYLYFILSTLFFAPNLQAQVITTIAGNGTQGYSGDGGLATAAELYEPSGLTFDMAGNIYFADDGNNCVRKIITSGIITTIAGNGIQGFSGDGGLATAAELYFPGAVSIDATGNIYIIDSGNNRVRKINTSGIITTIAGNGTAGFSGDGGVATNAELNEPDMLVSDANGNIYIADYFNNRIRKVDTSGIITTIAGTGIGGFSGDDGLAVNAEIHEPIQIVLDAAGNFYFADAGNSRIRKINTSGIISTVAGNGTTSFSGDEGQAISAGLYYPNGLVLDAAGNIYIADTFNNRVRKVDASGIITTVAGNGTAGFSGDDGLPINAELNEPNTLAFDASGNLFITDNYNNRIREITGITGIKELNLGAFGCGVFPNPSNGNMTITYSLNTGDIATFELFDCTGKKINTYVLSPSSTRLNINESNLSEGIYFYRITVNNALAKTDKLVIIK